jgi:hypothetical protein
MVRRGGEYGWSMFGEMEQNSLRHEGFRTMVKKMANMFVKKDFPQKRDIKRITHRKLHILPIFSPFLSLFIFRSIMVAT